MTNPISPRQDYGDCFAPSLSPFGPSPFHVSALRASINYRIGPAAEWLLERHDLAKQLVADSRKDISE